MLNVVGTLLTFLFLFSEIHAQTVHISPTGDGGFETGSGLAANGWTVVNDATNTWQSSGVAVAASGSNCAFISNNGGTTYAYSTGTTQTSHFYRDVTIPAGNTAISLSFNWKGSGELGYDRLLVYTATTSVTPLSNAPTSSSTTLTGATLVFTQPSFAQSTYTTASITLPAALAGTTVRLIFTWQNDGGGGTSPGAAVDNISLSSMPFTPISGTYTIDNTLANDPAGIQNFSSFTNAVSYLNIHGVNGALTLNVADGQTFAENVPALTATGTSTNTITFQKSGSGARPKITPTGSGASTDFGFALTGADYITWDGIDIDASAAGAVEYGLLVRNASSTNGAQNNTFRNFAITLSSRALSNTSYGILQTVSSTGGGVSPSAATGANSTNKYYNFSVSGVRNTGVYLLGNTSWPDLATEVGSTACANRNTISNIGPTSSTFVGASGIEASAQSGLKIFNTDVSAVAGNQSATQGIYVQNGLGSSEIYRSFVFNVRVFGNTTTSSIAYGMRLSQSTTGTNNLKVYGNMVSNVYTSFTGTATATRYAIGIGVGTPSATASQSYDVHSNTVSIGSGLTPTYSNTCLDIIGGVNHVLRVSGNIFANFTNAQTGAAKHTCISATATSQTTTAFGGSGSASSYNDLYIANTTNGPVARLGATGTVEYASTTTLEAAVASITNSISADPMFINNNTDLHATGSGVNDISGFTPDASVTTLGTDIDCASLSSPYDLGADTFTPLTCGLPTALVTSAIAYETATVSWTAPTVGTASGYNWEVRTSGAGGSGATGLVASGSVGSATVNLTGLTGGSTYTVYIQSDCSGDLGLWASVSLSTLNCNVPTAVTASAITTTGATISWTAPAIGSPAGYEYEVRSSGAAGSGSTGLVASGSTTAPTVSASISGLTANSPYSVYVRTNCYGTFFSSWTSAVTFTSDCDAVTTFPSTEAFGSYLPSTCWKEGTNGDLTAGPASTGASLNSWNADDFANIGSLFAGSAKYNLYQANNNAWLISPSYAVPASPAHRMTYDVAATEYAATTEVTDWEADDYVEVLISTSGMTNWTVIETYNASNVPSEAGQNEIYDLSAYAGQTVRFAFRVVEGASNGSADFDFFIDNIVVEETPSCLIPTGVSLFGATATTVDFVWTASASNPDNGYEWEVRTSGAAGSGSTGLAASGSELAGITAASAGSLSSNTTYSIYVRSNCGSGIFSAWTSALTVFTGYCTPAPISIDNLGITNVTFSGINNTTVDEPGNYADYTGLTGGNVQAGTTANVAITYETGYTYGTKIWVDLNNDLDFNDSGELVYTGLSSSSNPTTLNASFTINVSTTPGSYRMRIGGSDNDSGPDACYTGAYGTFEDYTLVVTAPPSCFPPTSIVATLSSTTSATLSWVAPSPTPGVGYEYVVSTSNTTPSNAANTGTATASLGASLTGLTPNSTYYVFVRSECTADSDYSSWSASTSFYTGYCQLTSSSTTYYISNFVTTGGSTNISNNTGAASPNGYGDFTAQSVTQQQTATVGFTFNMSSTFGSYGMAVFVDYNDDLDFDDAGETVYTTSSYSTVFTNSFTIPLTAPLGAHRMRVVADYSDSTPEACGLLAISTGEAEDYTLIVTAAPTCLVPSAPSAGTLTTVGATVSWTASPSSPAGYDIYVSTTNTAPGASPSSVIDATGTSFVINTLTSATTYYWWVRSDCGAGDVSFWVSGGSFTTACATYTDLNESFTDVASGVAPNCWTEIIAPSSFQEASASFTSFSGTRGGQLYNSDATVAANLPVLASPVLTNLAAGTHRVRFYARAASETSVIVGTLSNTSGIASFTPFQTVTINAGWVEYSVNFTAYAGTDVHLGFKHPGSVAYSYVYLDDIIWEVIPTCAQPTTPASSGITATTADLSWTAPTTAPSSGYEVYVSTINTAPASGPGSYTDFAGISGTVSSLTASTTYYWWVRSDCGAGDFSPWVSGGSFTTDCAPSAALPVSENFTTYLPSSCWKEANDGDLTAGPATIGGNAWGQSSYLNGVSTNQSAKFNIYQSGRDAWLITPEFTLPASPAYRMKYSVGATDYFDTAPASGWESDDFVQVLVTTSGMTNWTVLETYNAANVPSNLGQVETNVIAAYAGQNVRFAFRVVEGIDNGSADIDFFIDDFIIEELPSCVEPSSVAVSGVTSDASTVSWTASFSNPSNGYEWEIRTSGAAGSGATGLAQSGTVAAGVTTFGVTGLDPLTTYSVYVRSNCGSEFSSWTSAVSFTTACDPVSLPFTETFNTTSTSVGCWQVVDENGDAFVDDFWDEYYYYWLLTGTDPEYNASIYTSDFDNDDYLISPPIPLTGNEWVTFDFNASSNSYDAGFEVMISTTNDDPASFTPISSFIVPTNTSFDNMYIDLTAYTGTVYLAWHITDASEGFEYVNIDNVVVEIMPSCFTPEDVTVTGYGTNWNVAWTGTTSVVIEYGPAGFVPGTDNTAGAGGTVLTGTGSSAAVVLPADGYYDVYVRSNCTATADGYSLNEGPFSVNSYTVVPFSGSQTITTCGVTLYDHNGPTSNYANGADGVITIYPATAGSVVSLIGTIQSESSSDRIRVYAGAGTGGSLIATISGGSTTAIPVNVLGTALDQPITVRFTSNGSTNYAGFTLNVSCAAACGLVTSFPAPTSTLASVCSGESFTLSFPTVPAAIGYTYQWYSSPGGGAPFAPISGATSSILTTSQTVQTQYVCYVSCEYGDQVVTGIRTVYMNAPTACYPASGATNGGDEDINGVTVNGALAAVSNACGNNTYTDFTGTSVFNIGRGSQATLSIAACDIEGSGFYGVDAAAFIDFNQDGDFNDAGEGIYQAPATQILDIDGVTFNTSFTIPSTATLGSTRMRVIVRETSNITIPATGTYGYGETEDYTVTIVPGVANDLFANATNVANPSTYPTCSNVSGTLVGASDATAGVVGDDVFYKFTATGSAYRISTSGASGDVTLELRDGTNTLISSGVVTAGGTGSNEMLVATGLTNSVVYYVRVINQSVTPANFSVCIQKISGSGCNYGPNYSNLCSNFKSTWAGANSYSVTFFDGTNLYTGGSTGTTLFTLASAVGDPSNVLAGGLRYGTTYTATVTANYIFTDYSSNVLTTVSVPSTSPCSVTIGTQPNVALRSSDRSTAVGNNARAYGSFIACDPWLCATSEYLWRVTEIDPITEATISPMPVVIESNSSSRFLRINAATNSIFHTGGRYIIEVAPRFNAGNDGTFGTAYDLLIAGVAPGGMAMEDAGTEVVLLDKINEGGVFASLYPNPNNGESVNLNIAGIESESVNISIMDASGRVVWSNRYVVDGTLFTTVNFDRPLAAGMYMVEMVYNGQVMTQRMMVQK
jgi:hypothetical protein